jgi:hypothetical protein
MEEKFDAVDSEAEKKRISKIEERIFGVPIEVGSPLEWLYEFLTIEDIELISRNFDGKGFEFNIFNLVEDRSIFDSIADNLRTLGNYRTEYTALGISSPEAHRALENKYKPILTAINTEINKRI